MGMKSSSTEGREESVVAAADLRRISLHHQPLGRAVPGPRRTLPVRSHRAVVQCPARAFAGRCCQSIARKMWCRPRADVQFVDDSVEEWHSRRNKIGEISSDWNLMISYKRLKRIGLCAYFFSLIMATSCRWLCDCVDDFAAGDGWHRTSPASSPRRCPRLTHGQQPPLDRRWPKEWWSSLRWHRRRRATLQRVTVGNAYVSLRFQVCEAGCPRCSRPMHYHFAFSTPIQLSSITIHTSCYMENNHFLLIHG